MARRRPPRPAVLPGLPPECLLSMAGVAVFIDPAEPVTDAFKGRPESFRAVGGFARWLQARRDWAAAHGVDYVTTFRPEWRDMVQRAAGPPPNTESDREDEESI